MATMRIMATSGGFERTDRHGVVKPAATVLRMLELTGKTRPRVCLVMTASGDESSYLLSHYEALTAAGCDVTHLNLFPMPNADMEERICGSDAIWVGGGSVAGLLAMWRLHGLDDVMRQAWEQGVILGGVSAGSICWHIGGTTDSFGPELRPITDGLGLLPFANGVHYDSEEQRRPLLHRLVGDGTLPSAYATDDGVGILYEGTRAIEVVCEQTRRTAVAYLVEKGADGVVETRLPAGRIT